MVSRDLAQALAEPVVAEDGFPVEAGRLPTDVLVFEFDTVHAGPDPLDDQVAFEFRDRSDDDHDGAAQRAASADRFAEAHELDVKPVQLVHTSNKCLADWAIRSEAHNSTTLKRPRRASRFSSSSPSRRALAPDVRSVNSWTTS